MHTHYCDFAKFRSDNFDFNGTRRLGTYVYLTALLSSVYCRSSELYPDRTAIVCTHQDLRKSFAQVRVDVDKLAAGFVALGLEKGDRIGIWVTTTYVYIQ